MRIKRLSREANGIWHHAPSDRVKRKRLAFRHWTSRVRIQRFQNEAAAYVLLRRKGHSINNISTLLGRSTSFIARILNNFTKIDLRKLPRVRRLCNASKMRSLLLKLAPKWVSFILGESEEPP